MRIVTILSITLMFFSFNSYSSPVGFQDKELIQKRLVERSLEAVSKSKEARKIVADELKGRAVASHADSNSDHYQFEKSLNEDDKIDWFSKIDKETESSN